MQKRFNDTGLCVPHKHYMVDTTAKLKKIMQLIEWGEYFTINRPRQFGKTTTIFLLDKQLNQNENYIALKTSFEGIDTETHQHKKQFINTFLTLLARRINWLGYSEISQWINDTRQQITDLTQLSHFISQLIQHLPSKQWVLMIDEVDKSSNNQLFLDFLAMLRDKYLNRDEGYEHTFQSIILAGVHDIKTLKAKIRPIPPQSPPFRGGGEGGYNSPWNIAIDFEIDLSFSALEIETMLQDYSQHTQTKMDIPTIAQKLYYYTSGYPYLVSKLCKFIDEKITPPREDKNWHLADVEAATKLIVDGGYTTTLFDSLTKNLDNNPHLYELVFQIVINGENFPYIITNSVVNLGYLYGILVKSKQGHCQIHNRIFEQRIYMHMIANFLQTKHQDLKTLMRADFYTVDGLNIKFILQRFQLFMKEHYSNQDAKFLEREGRLLFLAYLRSIINGMGFDFKEPNVSHERRMDVVITYQNKRYVLELKIWRGAKRHKEGLEQLSDHLDKYTLKEGYLLIYDFNKTKQYKQEQIHFQDKHIFAVWV